MLYPEDYFMYNITALNGMASAQLIIEYYSVMYREVYIKSQGLELVR